MNMRYLTARAWLDTDGRHVWLRHNCTDEQVEAILPWPTWQATSDGKVEPSVNCNACALHAFLTLDGTR